MTDLLRQEIAALATTIVVKVGTRVLTREDGQLDTAADPATRRSGPSRAARPDGRWCWSAPGRSGPAWAAWG